eukprot:UN26155
MIVVRIPETLTWKIRLAKFFWQLIDFKILKDTYSAIYTQRPQETIFIIKQLFTWLETTPM